MTHPGPGGGGDLIVGVTPMRGFFELKLPSNGGSRRQIVTALPLRRFSDENRLQLGIICGFRTETCPHPLSSPRSADHPQPASLLVIVCDRNFLQREGGEGAESEGPTFPSPERGSQTPPPRPSPPHASLGRSKWIDWGACRQPGRPWKSRPGSGVALLCSQSIGARISFALNQLSKI